MNKENYWNQNKNTKRANILMSARFYLREIGISLKQIGKFYWKHQN